MRNNKQSKRELLELKIVDRRSKYNYINKKTDIVKKKIEPIKFETIFNDNKIEEINVQKDFKPITKPTRDERRCNTLDIVKKNTTSIQTNNNLKNRVGVLIVNLNNIKLTKECIDSLNNQINKNFKIYLVDQNSDEEKTDEFLDECIKNGIVVIKNKLNVPLNHVWNNFKNITDLEYLCFLNNDIVVSSNFIDDTIKVFNSNNKIGAVIHVTNNNSYCNVSHKLEYKIFDIPKYQGWDFTIKRELYPNIPESLLIFGGDVYIFAKLNTDKHLIALIYSSPIIHFKEKTRSKIDNIKEIQKQDSINFWNIINEEKLNICYSTMDDNTCIKFPPTNFKIKQNKNCVYTAIIGDYTTLTIPQKREENWDYICYTDNVNLKSDFWKVIYIENNKNDIYLNTKLSRYIKLNFMNYLSSYENILWVDGRISIKCDINNYLMHLDSDTDIVMVKHHEANSINDEFKRVLSGKLEKNETIEKIKKRYSDFNYNYDNGLIASGILLYKNNKKTIKFFNEWWYEVDNYSTRDQLSANFVLWKNKNIKYKMLSNILGNKFCLIKRTSKRLMYEQ